MVKMLFYYYSGLDFNIEIFVDFWAVCKKDPLVEKLTLQQQCQMFKLCQPFGKNPRKVPHVAFPYTHTNTHTHTSI